MLIIKKGLRKVELKKQVESLLFSSGKMMTEKSLAAHTHTSEEEVRKALEELRKDYDERDTSLMLVQSGDAWKLNVREKYMGLVSKIIADTELAFPVLETLAVIAYKAPVLQAEIIKIRGTNAYEHVGLLVKDGFVEKKKEGRSFKLTLTPTFFKYFDVPGDKDIKDALKEVKVPEKVGELEVVNIPKEDQKDKLGELEVVEEPPEEEKVSIENNKPDQNFLNDIGKRIDELSKKNDELDQDELFKRQEEVDKEMKEEDREEKEEDTETEKEPEEDTETEKEPEEDTEEEPKEEPKEEPEEEEKED